MAKDGVHSGLPHLEEALKTQLRYTSKELGPLIESRAYRFRYALFRRFAEMAPAREDIKQEGISLGYAIRRRRDKKGRRLTFEEEVDARAKSAKFLAFEFYLPKWRRLKKGQRLTLGAHSRAAKRSRIGQAVINTALGVRNPSVRIQGFLEGARIQSRRRGTLRKVENEQVADIAVYVARKMDQRHRQIYSRLSKALLPVKP